MADVGRITELWRAAAVALEEPLTTEGLSLITAMKLWRESEAECGRLREQLDAQKDLISAAENAARVFTAFVTETDEDLIPMYHGSA
jgi:hypothetical protein